MLESHLRYGVAGLALSLVLGSAGIAWASDDGAPTPPPPPPGAAQLYYGTCGGAHPVVQYVKQTAQPGTQEYRDFLRYIDSPEFKRYWAELRTYEARYGSNLPPLPDIPDSAYQTPPPNPSPSQKAPEKKPETQQPKPPDNLPAAPLGANSDSGMNMQAPEPKATEQGSKIQSATGLAEQKIGPGVNSYMGYQAAANASASSNPLGAATAFKMNRDPKQDLARWFRSFLYHDAVNPVVYDGQPESSACLEEPAAGPEPVTSHYAFLVRLLDFEAKAQAPNPQALVAALDTLWEKQWRHVLGFDADSSGRQLAGDLERAHKDAEAAGKRLEQLRKQAQADMMAAVRLADQIVFVEKEEFALREKERALLAQASQRADFILALVSALRLAPDNGFGPTFLEADLKAVQASAARILGAVGPMAAGKVWSGLAQDLDTLAKGPAQDERARRTQAVEAAQALLLDPRLKGLAVVCDYLREAKGSAPVLRKAFELLDRLGAQTLSADLLGALPALLGHLKHKDGEVAERARWILLRVLGIRQGKASLEEALGSLAPLTASSDGELAEAAESFLRYHTGQNRGRDAQAWLKLQQEMAAKRMAKP